MVFLLMKVKRQYTKDNKVWMVFVYILQKKMTVLQQKVETAKKEGGV